MSKWLKSTTQKAWTVSAKGKQLTVPPCETPDNRWLQVDDSEYQELVKSPVIASLLKAGGIMKLDEEPAELRNSVPALQITNTQLQAELDTARARIAELEANSTSVDVEAIKAEAVVAAKAEFETALAQKQKEFDDALAAKQQELEDLDAKASEIISGKDKTIAKLEKKLGKE